MRLEKDIEIDAFWADLRTPPEATLKRVLEWVRSKEPTLEVADLTNLLPTLTRLPNALFWTLGRGQKVLSEALDALSCVQGRPWSFTSGFVENESFNLLPELDGHPTLYSHLIEVRFSHRECLSVEHRRAVFSNFTEYLQANPEEALVFYQWAHLNEYVPRTVLVFDACDRASVDENADVERILTHTGPAIGVLRGNS